MKLLSLFVYNSFFFLLTEQKKKVELKLREGNPYVFSYTDAGFMLALLGKAAAPRGMECK